MLSIKLKTVRASVTRCQNKIHEELDKDESSESQIRLLVKEAKEYKERLSDLHRDKEAELGNKLEEAEDGEKEDMENEVEKEIQKMEEYVMRINQAIYKGELALEQMKSGCSGSHSSKPNIRLPKIALPFFSGNVLEWVEFFECFLASVNDTDLTDIEKFAYLRGQLSGDALSTISGLSLTNNNYKVALSLLKDRFGDTNVLIRAHIRELLKLDLVTNNNKDSLKKFVDKILVQTRSLESLGVTQNHFDIFLSEIVLSRIPFHLKMTYAKLDTNDQTLTQLIEILKKEIKGIDLAKNSYLERDVKFQPNTNRTNFSTPLKSIPPKKHESMSFSTTAKSFTCGICKTASHRTQNCRKLVDVEIDKRLELIKLNHLCFNCLGPHQIKSCQSHMRCTRCHKNHHSLLHRDVPHKTAAEETTVSCNASVQSTETFVPTVNLSLQTKQNGHVLAGALLDSGSHRSFVCSQLCDELKYRTVNRRSYSITGFNGQKVEGEFDEVECTMFDSLRREKLALRMIKLPSLQQHIPNQSNANNLLASVSKKFEPLPADIRIIIGCDNFLRVITGEMQKIDENICAFKTRAGLAIMGTATGEKTNISCNFAIDKLEAFPDVCIENFWKTELLDSDDCLNSNEQILSDFYQGISRHDGRYQIGFPWKKDKIMWSTFEAEAKTRLNFVVAKLVANSNLQNYDKIIKDYLANDIAEKVPDSEPEGQVRVLPHHPVFKPQSTSTKIRIVLDASAKRKENDYSLNDCVHEGQNFLSNLLGILLRFRQGEYAIIGDIEKAFLQLELKPADRDAVRFLWYDEDLTNSHPSTNPILFRMKRLPFGVKASPFLLCATIRVHLQVWKEEHPETTRLLDQNLYMDDFIFTTESKEHAQKIQSEAITIMNDMQMNLTKWITNFDENAPASVKVLGVEWMPQSDNLCINVHVNTEINTKRQLSSFICGLWDPYGFLSPFLITLKVILQSLWKEKFEWDEKLPNEQIALIKHALGNTNFIYNVPRCIMSSFRFEYHCYADASSKAYGACLYVMQFNDENKCVHSDLYISKSRLAPIRGMTIPKLELLAATLASKLIEIIRREVDSKPAVKLFTDSQVVLHWIKNKNKTWVQFVQRRVENIRKIVKDELWNHISSSENVADIVSRGCTLKELSNNTLWWKGITEQKTINDLNNIDELPEDISCFEIHVSNILPIMDLSRFSSFVKAVRVLTIVYRFINKCRKRSIDRLPFTVAQITAAEDSLIRNIQNRAYKAELDALKKGDKISPSSSIYQLNPFLDPDDNILKVNTRLQNSGLSTSEVYPKIIPKDSEMDRLLIQYHHQKLMHAGVNTTFCDIRKKYWLPKGRRRIKEVIKKCNLCKIKNVSSNSERWAPMPIERVNTLKLRAFLHVGIDYFGPLISKEGKIYVLLLTCLQTRAIHLELARSLETAEFLRIFSQFTARRGTPETIHSDNAKTFKGAQSTIASLYHCTWKFIVERSPHKGGAWERLIQCVKAPLRLLIRNKILSTLEIQTLLCNVEFVVNSRPLTYLSENIDDCRPLTPNDFLVPEIMLPDIRNFDPKKDLTRIILARNKTLEMFFERWKIEYLKERLSTGTDRSDQELRIGDIVLIDDGKRREFWPLGRIETVNKGRDGNVRSVLLRCRGKVLRRGIERVYPIERVGECVES